MDRAEYKRWRRIRAKIVSWMAFGGVMAILGGVAYTTVKSAAEGGRKNKEQSKIDQERVATLIDKKEGVVGKASYATIFFLDTDAQTNTAEIVAQAVAHDAKCIEALRTTAVGTTKKVSEWKSLFIKKNEQIFTQESYWHELGR
ncbi:MAG: hypothetical protein SPL08_05730 [Pseudomonadota bacterium]|nr:hypothetical protein [Pseudomonadota bacterium]